MLRLLVGLALSGAIAGAAQAQVDDDVDPDIIPEVEEATVVAVVAPDEHQALEGCLEGMRAALPQFGYFDDENLELIEAIGEADGSDLDEKAREAVAEEPAAIVPISPAAATAVAAETDEIPIVFCAIPDPVDAGLMTDTMRPGGNITGVSDRTLLSEVLALIREVLPEVQMLGVVHDADNEASARLMERLEQFTPGAGFRIVEANVGDPDEVADALRSLTEEAEVFYLPSDPAVIPALDEAIEIAEETDTPLFVGDADLVERGALGSRGFQYIELGRRTAGLLARVLDGESPGNIPVIQGEDTTLVINVEAAERMGVQLAPGFIARAGEVIQ